MPPRAISIHAPTRGATISLLIMYATSSYFNPRSHERSDKEAIGSGDSKDISIHAPTRGATSAVGHYELNSTISIHAPTRGATVYTVGSMRNLSRFQSTLPREERLIEVGDLDTENIKFQSTLPREERPRQKCR